MRENDSEANAKRRDMMSLLFSYESASVGSAAKLTPR